jgi:hypothetical protein
MNEQKIREAFEKWKDDYGLVYEPNYSKATEADCLAAYKAGYLALLTDLAEREAEIAKLRNALDVIGDINKEIRISSGITKIVRDAITNPPSTSYLEQWEKEKYGEPVAYEVTTTDGLNMLMRVECQLVGHSSSPLYARKD